MRLLPILTVAMAFVVIAGCTKSNSGDNGGTSTTPPPTSSTPMTSTPTSSTPSSTPTTSTPPTNTTPTVPMVMPMALCSKVTYDFSGNQPDPSNPGSFTVGKKDCGTASAGYTSAAMSVNWSDPTGGQAPSGLALANGLAVKLIDPSKKTVATCAGPQGPYTPPDTVKCTGTLTGPGDYTLEFDGSGAVTGSVTVNIS